MAVLTAEQLAIARREFEASFSALHNRDVYSAGLQAIEDWFEANRSALSSAINAATAPATLSIAEKKALAKTWMLSKFNRGG